MAASQRLSPKEVELYFAAGISVPARNLPRAERRRALDEGRALGISSFVGDFASGEASMVPLGPGDSLSKVKVVVPPGQRAAPCFSSDREHEVWDRFYEAQVNDGCHGLTPDATERVRHGSRELAVELARQLPAEVADPLLEQWAKPATRAQTYLQWLFDLTRIAARVPNPPPMYEERLRRDAQRKFIGLVCRAKLARDVAAPAPPIVVAPVPPIVAAPAPPIVAAPAPRNVAAPAPPFVPGVALRIGQRTLLLVAHPREEIADRTAPTEVRAPIRCEACATVTTYTAPVSYVTYDDDHYGRFELWYESPIRGSCSTCGGGIDVMLRYTLTELTGVSPHRYFIELDTVEEKQGKLAAPTP